MDVICNNCKKQTPMERVCVCAKCGTLVCSDCAEKKFYRCDCDGKYSGVH